MHRMNTEYVYIVHQILREILHGSHNIHDTYIKQAQTQAIPVSHILRFYGTIQFRTIYYTSSSVHILFT